MRDAVAAIERDIAPIDILVNNAGIQRRAPFESFPEETWREIMAANLDSVFHVTQAVGARMLERRRGRIINICSVASELGRATIVPYAATKGALRQMTRGLCAEWAARNIQINAIAPGYIRTELNRALIDDAAFSAWVCAAHAGRTLGRRRRTGGGGDLSRLRRRELRQRPRALCRWRAVDERLRTMASDRRPRDRCCMVELALRSTFSRG